MGRVPPLKVEASVGLRRPTDASALSVRDTLFLLSLDLRTSWDEPPDPVQEASWRLWWAMERADREIPTVIRAIGRTRPPVLSDAGR